MFQEELALYFFLEARRTSGSFECAIKRVYRIIVHKFNTDTTEGRNIRYWVNKFGMNDNDAHHTEINQDIFTADELTALGQSMYYLFSGATNKYRGRHSLGI